MRLRALLLMLLLSSCISKTEHGKCIGLNARLNGTEDPNLIYEFSARNIILGFLGGPFVAPPVIVILGALECPVAKREQIK